MKITDVGTKRWMLYEKRKHFVNEHVSVPNYPKKNRTATIDMRELYVQQYEASLCITLLLKSIRQSERSCMHWRGRSCKAVHTEIKLQTTVEFICLAAFDNFNVTKISTSYFIIALCRYTC